MAEEQQGPKPRPLEGLERLQVRFEIQGALEVPIKVRADDRVRDPRGRRQRGSALAAGTEGVVRKPFWRREVIKQVEVLKFHVIP